MACTATCQYGRYLGPSLQTSLMCKAHLPRHRTSAAKTSRFGPTSWYLTDFCGSNRKLPCRELPPAFANCKEYPRSFATNASSPRPTNSRPEHGPSEKPLRGGNGLGDPPFARKRDMDLKAGPYRRGRIFISPREDPKEFVLSCLVVFVMLYTLYHLPRGTLSCCTKLRRESLSARGLLGPSTPAARGR